MFVCAYSVVDSVPPQPNLLPKGEGINHAIDTYETGSERRDLNGHKFTSKRDISSQMPGKIDPVRISGLDQSNLFRSAPSLNLGFPFPSRLERLSHFTPYKPSRAGFGTKSWHSPRLVMLDSGGNVFGHARVDRPSQAGDDIDEELVIAHGGKGSHLVIELKTSCHRRCLDNWQWHLRSLHSEAVSEYVDRRD